MRDLTNGALRHHILKLTGFILVNMIVYTLYSLVDLYWVSRLDTQAVAAVSISANLMTLTMAATQVLDVGTAALLSHAVGRKDHPQAQLCFNQSQVMAGASAIVFAVLFFAGHLAYLRAFAADAETLRLGAEFMVWFIPATAMQFVLVGLSAALRGIGHMRPGMIAQVGSVVLNMILSPILIFGWLTGHPLGVAGAGLATFLSIVAGTAGLILYFRRQGSYLRWDSSQWRPRFHLWRQLLRVGLPAGGELALMLIYMLVIFGIIRTFGSDAQAGFGIGVRIMTAAALPSMAVSFALAAVAGQNFGAGHSDRVREAFRVGAIFVCCWMVLMTILFQIAPQTLIGGFSRDPEVLAAGGEFLGIISWTLVASGMIATCSGLFQAMGNTVPPLIASAIRILLITILALWLAQRPSFELWQLWWMSVVTIYLHLGLSMALLRREFARRLTPPTVAQPIGETR